MPTISREDLDKSSFHLTITLLREDLKPKLDAEFKKFKSRAAIKGFRPGQAPAQYVKSLYGSSIFYDVFNKMMSDELYGYLREQKIDVLGQPLPVEDQNQKFSFKIDQPEAEYPVTYEIGYVPEFDLPGLDKSAVYERLEVSDLDTLASADLEDARKRAGKRIQAEDDILENDILRVKSQELDGGKIKEGGWETTITLFVKNITSEELLKQVLTLKKGDTFQFDVNQLENEQKPEFIRKYILNIPEDDTREVGSEFEGVIEEVSRVGVAELDEEFFNSYFGGGVSNETEAMDELKKNIAQYYLGRANALVMRDMQDRLLDEIKIELPEKFLKRWLKLTNEGKVSADDIEKEYDSFATGLRWSLIRDKMKERYNVVVSEQEIKDEFANTLRNYFRANLPEEVIQGGVKRMMADEKEVERVTSNIEYEKMFTAAIDEVTIKGKPVTSEEFHAIFDQAKQATAAAGEGDEA